MNTLHKHAMRCGFRGWGPVEVPEYFDLHLYCPDHLAPPDKRPAREGVPKDGIERSMPGVTVARILGVCKQRVDQLERSGLAKLRKAFEARGLSLADFEV
jgi:hypothetical protein